MEILLFIQEHLRTAFGDLFFPFVTMLGNAGWIWILAGIALLFHRRTRRCGIAMLLSLAVTYTCGELVLKNIVQRPRPFIAQPGIELLISPPGGFSFPSGHSGSSFTAATALFYFHRKAGAAALVLAALIAFSRLYLFVHYPTDVLAGSLLGIAAAVLICREIRRRIV